MTHLERERVLKRVIAVRIQTSDSWSKGRETSSFSSTPTEAHSHAKYSHTSEEDRVIPAHSRTQ